MKKNYKFITLCLLLLLAKISGAVQLTGTYTINPSATATATNFQNIISAVTYLTSASARTDGGPANATPFGVSGPVTFNISAGTFTGQITIPAITGASTTNTITFKGNSRTTTIVTFAATVTGSRHTVGLNLATNVTFRDMTLRGTGGTYGWVVHITGTNSNNNKIKNCQIELTGTGATSTSTNFAGIVISGSATSATTGIRVDGTEIDSNTISNTGYYGLAAVGLSGNLQADLKLRNNQILGAGVYSCYLNYQNGVTIDYNFLNQRTSYMYNYGIYFVNSTSASGKKHVITNNRIINFGYGGIYLSSTSNPTGNKGLIANNVIGGLIKYEYCNPLYLSSSSQWRIVHNSINQDMGGYSNSYCPAYFNSGSGNAVYNNIFSHSKPGQGLALYASSSAVFDTLNFNLYNRADTSNGVLIYVGTNYNSGSFRGANSQNLNSMVANPLFVNDTNLRVDNACFAGMPASSFPVDFIGVTRSTTNPTMGAYEVIPVANNLQLVKISAPTPPLTAGLNDLKLFVRNNGNNTVTSFNASYSNNGGTVITLPWSGTLAPCDTVTIEFNGSNQINIGNINNILAYTASPNSSVDANRNNDSIRAQFYLPLSGNYTIGGTSPDFATATDAVQALYLGGVTGPISFSVRPGTYVGQLTFDNPIIGASATNTILFEGVNRTTSIIEFNNTTNTERHVIRIGQSNITFRNLTIRSYSQNYAWGVHISKNYTSNIAIKNCDISMLSSNAIAGTSEYFGGVVMSGSNTALNFYDTYILDNIQIDSNNITNGYFGVFQFSYFYSYYYTYGAQSEKIYIRNNNIKNVYYYGIYAEGLKGVIINNNTVSMMKSPGNYSYTIYVSNVSVPSTDYDYSVSYNKMYNNGYMGLYQNNIMTLNAKRGKVINNVVAGGFTVPGSYGFYCYNNAYLDIFHNSVLVDDVSTSNTTAAIYLSSGSSNKIRNNHFVVANSLSLGIPMYLETTSIVASALELNYNNYYKADTFTSSYLYVGGWKTYANFRGSGGYNLNSIGKNPSFVNDTNLVTLDGCMNGDTIASVTTDINNLTRATIPDMGAYEVSSYSEDAAVTGLNAPVFPIPSGLQDVVIKFKNNGTNSLTSLNVGYTLNGGPVKTTFWFGTLGSCDTSSATLTGADQINVLPGVTNTLKIFTASPNFLADGNVANDTMVLLLGTPLKGNYIIGSAPSDFATISAATNALQIRGVDSIVNFRIKTGTYNQQFVIPNFMGASSQNIVTFTSFANHVDSVIINNNSTSLGNNFIVKFTGGKYVVFDKLTLTAQNSSYSKVFDISSNSGFITIQNCKLNAPVGTSTSNYNYLISTTNNTIGNINILKNRIVGGSMAVYLFGTATNNLCNNNTIDSNIISNQYYMSMYLAYGSNDRIRFNTISTTSTYTVFYGIYGYYVDSLFEIIGNNFSTTTANGYGIYAYYCDGYGSLTGSIVNNMVRIGSGSTSSCWGIRSYNSNNSKILNNTVLVNSTSATSYAGYFYFSSSIYTNNIIRNNVFYNMSTGLAIYHYNPLYSSSNYNSLFTAGTVLSQKGTPAATYADLATTKTGFANNYETHSIQYRPGLVSATNLAPNPADTASWSLNGRGEFVGVTTDINNQPRSTSVATGATDIGAVEFTPTSTPPLCQAIPSVAVAGGTQVFLFGGDSVATIFHDAFTTPPTFLSVRQYTGANPPGSNFMANYFNMYLSTNAPAAFYNSTLKMFYKKEWTGTVPLEQDIRLSQKTTGFSWSTFSGSSSTVDTTLNTITAPFVSSFSVFTGTDEYSPLPVRLVNFNGVAREQNALLNWATASEINSNSFEVERSFNNRNFEKIGVVRAKGNTNSLSNYSFTDNNILNRNKTVYYRLKMVDNDNTFAYSNVVTISSNVLRAEINVGPNPFKNSFVVNNLIANEKLEVIDINGKSIYKTMVQTDGSLEILLPETLSAGIYFLKVQGNNEDVVIKLVKN